MSCYLGFDSRPHINIIHISLIIQKQKRKKKLLFVNLIFNPLYTHKDKSYIELISFLVHIRVNSKYYLQSSLLISKRCWAMFCFPNKHGTTIQYTSYTEYFKTYSKKNISSLISYKLVLHP